MGRGLWIQDRSVLVYSATMVCLVDISKSHPQRCKISVLTSHDMRNMGSDESGDLIMFSELASGGGRHGLICPLRTWAQEGVNR